MRRSLLAVRRIRNISFFFLATACCVLSPGAAAAVKALAVHFDGGQFEADSSVVGWEFRTGPHPLHVVALGVHDSEFTGPDEALAFNHDVGIFRSDTQTLVGVATVPSGSVAPFADGFRYVAASFILQPNSDYVAAATWPGIPPGVDFPEPVIDDYAFLPLNTAFAIPASEIVLPASGGARQENSASDLQFPSFRYDDFVAIVGPNFQFEVLNIPEPGVTRWFAVFGPALLFGFLRRNRSRRLPG